ncbi:hypothetical protein Micbo1qcDRAFT_164894 [Microdochium bolleyi]|uniref:Uncharacterized protein n=1 Tax=Microdochium bolleyi TaxID=196109 RepID=A0A136IXZ8_9PEZI|nr:hypothetical protein Micbo1qcDRAFT_164894 [Microdochium bolleyi]
MEMADYFHDPKGASATFKRWLYTGTSRPFGRKMNTWLGLFYTIDGCWNPSIPAQSQKRRPWAVVLRPVNAHDTRKPYTAMELLIWDSLAESDAADTPDLSCLIDMQARLVDFVKEEIAHGEVPDYYLSRVWLSNRLDRDMDTRGHPLEVACQQVELMARETRFWLPPYEVPLQARGWVQVSMSRSSSGRNKATLSRAELFNEPFPKCSADAALPEQIIFHPLRSQAAERRVANRKPSQCSNDMYKAALEARKKDRNCSTARLQYRPTMQWYADLKEEKRDASHVLVDTWEGISFRLRKAGQKSGQKTGSRPSSSG